MDPDGLVAAGLEQIDRAVRGYLSRNPQAISDDDADDVRQYLAEWLIRKGIPSWDGRIDFDAYVTAFIRWRLVDAFRTQIWCYRRGRERPLSLDVHLTTIDREPFTLGDSIPDPTPGPDTTAIAITELEAVAADMNNLTAFQRACVWRTAHGELGRDVAADWGTHESTVSLARTAARARLTRNPTPPTKV